MKRLKALALAVLLFLAAVAPAIGRTLLEFRGSNLVIELTDQPCTPKVAALVRSDWPFATFHAVVTAPVGVLDACYSVTPNGITIVDENGQGPGGPIPMDAFTDPHAPKGGVKI